MKTKTLINIFSDPLTTVYYLLIAIALSLVIATVYRKTHKSVSYSQSFTNSLVMLLPLVALIINIVNTNVARAIGVFGAFSVTRFRTPIKDARDMIYIFWSLAIGLAVGAGEIGVAITATLIIALLALLLHLTDFGINNNFDYLLIVNLSTKKGKIDDVESVVQKYAKEKEIVNIQSDKSGENLEISTNLKLKKGINIDNLVSEIRKVKGVGSISISPCQNTIEF